MRREPAALFAALGGTEGVAAARAALPDGFAFDSRPPGAPVRCCRRGRG